MQSNQNEEKIQLFNSMLSTDAVVPLHKPGLAQAGRGGEPGGAGKPACSGPAASPIRQRALPSHPGEESRAVIFPVKQPKFQEWGPGRQTPPPPSPPSHHRAPMRSVPFLLSLLGRFAMPSCQGLAARRRWQAARPCCSPSGLPQSLSLSSQRGGHPACTPNP